MESVTSGEFERPRCLLCRTLRETPFPEADRHLALVDPLHVVRCRSCDLAFLSPRPGPALRAELQSGRVPGTLAPYARAAANYGAVTEGRSELFERRLRELALLTGAIPEQAKGRRLLDVGASSGVLVALARQRGWAAHGVEASAAGVAAARGRGVILARGVAEALPFEDAAFDVVHSHHVFEHLADPFAAASSAVRVLRPGGFFYLEVPNQFANVMFQRDILLRRVPVRERNIRSIHHLWFFSRRSIARLLGAVGLLDVVVQDAYGGTARGWRRPFSAATRLVGRVAGGGDILRAWGRKPA